MQLTRLTRSFYQRPSLTVASELLGKMLRFSHCRGLITEVEAYIGATDPACHAAKGYTPRTAVMFGPAGFSYVYLIYGLYHCLNIVTEAPGFPAAILIRGLQLLEPQQRYLNGPGRLCQELTLTKQHNQQDLTVHPDFGVYDTSLQPNYICTPRIGIRVGQEKFWRFKTTSNLLL